MLPVSKSVFLTMLEKIMVKMVLIVRFYNKKRGQEIFLNIFGAARAVCVRDMQTFTGITERVTYT